MRLANCFILLVCLVSFSSAFADGKAQYITSCSGVDSRGNSITLSLVALPGDVLMDNQTAVVVELGSYLGNIRYNVMGQDVDSADVYENVTSSDHGGIAVNTEGDGEIANGKIGILHSTFDFSACTPGPGAP